MLLGAPYSAENAAPGLLVFPCFNQLQERQYTVLNLVKMVYVPMAYDSSKNLQYLLANR